VDTAYTVTVDGARTTQQFTALNQGKLIISAGNSLTVNGAISVAAVSAGSGVTGNFGSPWSFENPEAALFRPVFEGWRSPWNPPCPWGSAGRRTAVGVTSSDGGFWAGGADRDTNPRCIGNNVSDPVGIRDRR
jgi:hypothetical protein